jgi:hypothetical protein
LNYFWEGAATKIPEKIKLVGFVSRAQVCHKHKMSATTNYLWKRNGPRKPEMFYITFHCYHLNQVQTWPGPEHYLCSQAWPLGQVGPRLEARPRPVQTSNLDYIIDCIVWHMVSAKQSHEAWSVRKWALIEQVGVAIMLYILVQEVPSSDLGWVIRYHDWHFSWFSSVSSDNAL